MLMLDTLMVDALKLEWVELLLLMAWLIVVRENWKQTNLVGLILMFLTLQMFFLFLDRFPTPEVSIAEVS